MKNGPEKRNDNPPKGEKKHDILLINDPDAFNQLDLRKYVGSEKGGEEDNSTKEDEKKAAELASLLGFDKDLVIGDDAKIDMKKLEVSVTEMLDSLKEYDKNGQKVLEVKVGEMIADVELMDNGVKIKTPEDGTFELAWSGAFEGLSTLQLSWLRALAYSVNQEKIHVPEK